MLLNRGIIDIQLRGGHWIRRQPPWKRSSVAHSSERGWARPATQGHNGDRAVKRQKGWEGNTGKKPQCGFHGKEEQVRLCEQQWAEGKPLCLWVSEFSICKIPHKRERCPGFTTAPRRTPQHHSGHGSGDAATPGEEGTDGSAQSRPCPSSSEHVEVHDRARGSQM